MRRQEGFVLVSTLIIALIALIMLLGLSYLIFYGTRLMGTAKRYSSALEAAKGGALECLQALQTCSISNTFKCEHSTSVWNTYVADVTPYTSHSNPDDIISHPDWQKNYGSYTVYCKVVHTQTIINGYLYGVEVVGRRQGGQETAWISLGYRLDIVGL